MRTDAWRNVLLLLLLPGALLAVGFGVKPTHDSLTTPPPPPEFVFAAGRLPVHALGPVDLAAINSASVAPGAGWFQVTVAAAFPDAPLAAEAADAVADLLAASARHYEDPAHASARRALLDETSSAPLTPPEAIRLAKVGITGLRAGIGWPGASSGAHAAPLVLGRLVVVCGLKGDFAGLQPNPLAGYLERLGGELRVEGDPGLATPFVLDLSCFAPDAATAARLADLLQRYLSAPPELFLRPPWHPKGVSPGEQRARETYQRAERVVLGALRSNTFLDLSQRMLRAQSQGEAESARREWLEALTARSREALEALEGDANLDRDLLRALLENPLRGGLGRLLGDDPKSLRLAAKLGQLDLEVRGAEGPGPARFVPSLLASTLVASAGAARADGRRLDLGGIEWVRFGPGFTALLAYLERKGCREIRVAWVDRP